MNIYISDFKLPSQVILLSYQDIVFNLYIIYRYYLIDSLRNTLLIYFKNIKKKYAILIVITFIIIS